MQQRPFTIDKVAWHTKIKGNPETREQVIKRFQVFVAFLQENNLTARELLMPSVMPDDDFAIMSSDLTDKGMLVVKMALDKWTKKIVNKRKDVSDISVLKDALLSLESADALD